jgi:hypothetical protein
LGTAPFQRLREACRLVFETVGGRKLALLVDLAGASAFGAFSAIRLIRIGGNVRMGIPQRTKHTFVEIESVRVDINLWTGIYTDAISTDEPL